MLLPARRLTNTTLLMVILVAVTLYQSKMGGPGSPWNAVAVAAGAAFVFTNLQLSGLSLVLFAVPTVLLLVSTFANLAETSVSGLRSALATSVGFGLFALPPVSLNRRLLRRLITVYVLVCLALSLGVYVSRVPEVANANFSINPNAAANLFFMCAALTMCVMRSRVKWLLVFMFAMLMVTTQARMGAIALAASIIGFAGLATPRRSVSGKVRILTAAPLLLLGLFTIDAVVPSYVDRLLGRFQLVLEYDAWSLSRLAIWEAGFRMSLESPRSILVGHGPASISRLIGSGSHSSFVEAAGSYGYVFLFTSMMTWLLWTRMMVRRGHREVLAVGVPLIAYAAFETFMFSGVSMLWFLLALVGIYVRARPETAGRPLPYVAGPPASHPDGLQPERS